MPTHLDEAEVCRQAGWPVLLRAAVLPVRLLPQHHSARNVQVQQLDSAILSPHRPESSAATVRVHGIRGPDRGSECSLVTQDGFPHGDRVDLSRQRDQACGEMIGGRPTAPRKFQAHRGVQIFPRRDGLSLRRGEATKGAALARRAVGAR